MRVFLDTSSLFKLYHKEIGTEDLLNLFKINTMEAIYLAEIAKIEFSSVIWRKCRMKEIDEFDGRKLLEKFEKDYPQFSFVPDTDELRSTAKNLIEKHWKTGLRTLDSIQLSTAISVKNEIERFISADRLLIETAKREGFKT